MKETWKINFLYGVRPLAQSCRKSGWLMLKNAKEYLQLLEKREFRLVNEKTRLYGTASKGRLNRCSYDYYEFNENQN